MGWPLALSLRMRRRGWTVAIPPGGDASPLYRRGLGRFRQRATPVAA